MKSIKSIVIVFLSLVSTLVSRAQDVDDIVSVGEGYVNESYYSMNNGEVAIVNNVNWDIAFDVSPIEINMTTFEVKGYAIRINAATGTTLKMYPHGTVSEWSALDTSGIGNWPLLYNPENTWSQGAFDRNLNDEDVFDFGWGVYNPVTHILTGDSLYVIQLGNGSFKKIWIEKMELEEYFFKYADLDGSNEVSQSIAKSDYPNRNNVFYSLLNDQIIDREPESGNWDIVFTRYTSEIIPEFFLTVTGAFSNKGIEVAQADEVSDPFEYEDFESETFESDINVIGYDWKSFNETTFQWSIVEDLCYFVKDYSSNIWRLTFSYFGGSSNGEIAFNKELIAALNVEEYAPITLVNAYPNPAKEQITTVFSSDLSSVIIELSDLTGKSIITDQINNPGLNAHSMDVSGIESGIYILTLRSNGFSKSIKVIVE